MCRERAIDELLSVRTIQPGFAAPWSVVLDNISRGWILPLISRFSPQHF